MMFTLSLTLASNLLLAPPTEEEIKTKIEAAMTFFREKGDDFSLEDPEFHAVLDAQRLGRVTGVAWLHDRWAGDLHQDAMER